MFLNNLTKKRRNLTGAPYLWCSFALLISCMPRRNFLCQLACTACTKLVSCSYSTSLGSPKPFSLSATLAGILSLWVPVRKMPLCHFLIILLSTPIALTSRTLWRPASTEELRLLPALSVRAQLTACERSPQLARSPIRVPSSAWLAPFFLHPEELSTIKNE